jgi:hypothetical protein
LENLGPKGAKRLIDLLPKPFDKLLPYPNTPPMATKRKCEDDKPMVQSAYALRALLYFSIFFHGSPEIALLHIMEEHNFSLRLLEEILSGPSIHLLIFWKLTGFAFL